jgi:hypothetical protein
VAATAGRLVCLWALPADRRPVRLSAETHRARPDALIILRTVARNGPSPKIIRGLCTAAARGGKLTMLQWMRTNMYSIFTKLYDPTATNPSLRLAAAEGGHVAVLQWLRVTYKGYNHTSCTSDILHPHWAGLSCVAAARAGQLPVVQWLRANGCDCQGVHACNAAAGGGHLPVLQWLRANGSEWHRDTVAMAARGGHLEVIQWLRSNGCEWGEWPWANGACSAAVDGGHLTVLQWLRANGCRWHKQSCLDLVQRKQRDRPQEEAHLWTALMEWIVAH